jgi:membrane-associated protease RseP (regulator of RpoE activity)
MLRFSLLGFPVNVHWMFWVVGALFGGSWATGLADFGYNPGLFVAAFIAVLFISIFVHELGHTLTQKKFLGARPRIVLHGFGGLAIPEGGRTPTRTQSVIISAMGPVFGLVLGALVWQFGAHFAPESVFARRLVRVALLINIFWSLVNLLPMLPLDGGHILQAALAHKPQRIVYQIGMVTAGAAAVLMMVWGFRLAPFLFGFFAYENYQALKNLGGGGMGFGGSGVGGFRPR